MHPGVFRRALVTSLCVCAAVVGHDLKSALGSDCILPCTVTQKPGVRYRAVTWYKVGEMPSPRLSGLLTRNLTDGTTRRHAGVARDVQLLDGSRHVLLANVTCDDRGVYSCHLAAPVGERDLEGQVRLTVTDCPDDPGDPDTHMVTGAVAMLALALVIFLASYVSLKKALRSRTKSSRKQTLLNAPLRALDKRDLMLIYTLGPKWSRTPPLEHICV
ncbi:CD83 antigen-like [Brachionichthys hirsutus]|uniref:CD83 antigen-like n=1 Tax=Brachionichthys hirsutus TaxID=412623 RepID=UPI00360544AA